MEEDFYVNRGALIIALILKVGVKNILIIYPFQITISIEIFLTINELRPFLMLKTKLMGSVRSYTNGNKMNFFEDFIGGSSLLDPPPTKMLDSICLIVKKWSPCSGSLSRYCKSFRWLLRHEFLNRKKHEFIIKITWTFVKLVTFLL